MSVDFTGSMGMTVTSMIEPLPPRQFGPIMFVDLTGSTTVISISMPSSFLHT